MTKQPEKAPKCQRRAAVGLGRPLNRPGQDGTINSDDDPNDRLNRLFGQQTDETTPEQGESVRRWQQRDRYYVQVQGAVRDEPGVPDEAFRVVYDLQELAQPLPEDVDVWRGIRSIEDTFGTPVDQVQGRPDQIVARFMSTSTSDQVARGEFTAPGGNPALMKIRARAGTSAVWMPPIGDPSLAHQGELLFMPGCLLRILGVDTSGDIPVIEAEVSQP